MTSEGKVKKKKYFAVVDGGYGGATMILATSSKEAVEKAKKWLKDRKDWNYMIVCDEEGNVEFVEPDE